MKFNLSTKRKTEIRNHEGAKAYQMTPEFELYSAVVTASLDNRFYESGEDRVNRIVGLIQKVDPVFVAKLAVYTRKKMYLRSIPLVLVVELGKIHSGDSLISKTVEQVIGRADEITELLAYYQLANKRNDVKKLNRLSKQLQKGLAASFNKFDEYQFAKYNRQKEVMLKDALFLVHPKAKDEKQQVLFDKIVNGTLDTPYTWEVEISAIPKHDIVAVKQKWTELIESGRLGYMALMRNLRNILQADVNMDILEKVGNRIADADQVRRAKQLPFRFLAAYRELEVLGGQFTGRKAFLMDSLEKAAMVSAENIKGFDLNTRVLLAADVSGSMYTAVSQRSKIRAFDIGLLLSMLMRSRSKNVITGIFGNRWKAVNMPVTNVLKNTQDLNKIEGSVGYATNGFKVIDYLRCNNLVMDKVMLFTDVQMWNSKRTDDSFAKSWKAYKKIAPNAKLYLFDLVGYGQSPLSLERDDVYLIAGWSDKVFDILNAIDEGESALNEIMKIEL